MVACSTRFSLLLFLLVCCSDALIAADEEAVRKRNEALLEADRIAFEENMEAYRTHVEPFLKQHCIGCHGPKKLEGDLSLDLLDPDMKESASASRWATVRDRLESGEMPPPEKPRPEAKQTEQVVAWIRLEMKRSRRNFARRQQVINGNKVPHALLFDPDHHSELDVPARLRRLSPQIYHGVRAEQAKGFENLVSNPFTADPRFQFGDMGSPEMDVPTTSQLLRNAITIVERQTAHTIEGGKIKPVIGAKKEFLKFIDANLPFEQEQMAQAITMQFQRTLGRSPTSDELARFTALMKRNVDEAGRVSGVRYTLAAVHLLPESVFRFEVGHAEESGKKRRLTSREVADALSFALTDKRASSWLLQAAEKGELDDAEGVASAVQKMFDDPKMNRSRILRFFHEYFEYHRAPEVFKNRDEFGAHKAKILVSDTDQLVQWILERDRDVLKELLTTDRAFVNTRWDSNKKMMLIGAERDLVHLSYNLPPDWKWTAEQPIKLSNQMRAGILTQPSWLVAWSMNQDNHAILRGKWVRERLLGNVVPDLPITVDAQLPHAPEKTLRERMNVTKEAYCWQCHKLMNPVGLPFEMFDHFGRWRATELGQRVDATGRIDLTGQAGFDVDTGDAIEFVHKLAESEYVEQVFVRHVFRYFTGRNENPGDGPSLRAAHRAYTDSGGSFKALVTSILSSESFLYRTPERSLVDRTPE